MKFTICIWASLYLPLFLNAQLTNEWRQDFQSFTREIQEVGYSREIKPGQRVPEVLLQTLKGPTSYLSEYLNVPVLLDFWSTTCASCVREFQKLDSLQKQFGDSIAILPVTWESKEYISQFFDQRKSKGLFVPENLTFITNDRMLRKYFPHVGQPHEAWIDCGGILKFVTTARYVTASNISAFINGDTIAAHPKVIQRQFSPFKLFLTDGNGGSADGFQYRSMVTAYNDSIGGPAGYFPASYLDGRFNRIFLYNKSVESLYSWAYNCNGVPFPSKQIILDVHDPHSYRLPSHGSQNIDDWRKTYTFCYELVLPATFTSLTAYSIMQQDLDRFFELKGRVEQREVECLVLTNNSNIRRNKAASDTLIFEPIKNEKQGILILRNASLKQLSDCLNYEARHLPVILSENGTDQHFPPIKLHLEQLTSMHEVQSQLEPYGIMVKSTTRKISVLIISEKRDSESFWLRRVNHSTTQL